MKTAYIISYDLSHPGQRYENVLQAIKSYHDWARLGGSAYIILTESSTAQVRDTISAVMDRNDQLFVGTVTSPAAWYGLSDEVSDWLKKNL